MSNITIVLDKDALKSLIDNDPELELKLKDSVLRHLMEQRVKNFLTEEGNQILDNQLRHLLATNWNNEIYDGKLKEYATNFKKQLIAGLQTREVGNPLDSYITDILSKLIEAKLQEKPLEFRLTNLLASELTPSKIEKIVINYIKKENPDLQQYISEQIKNKLLDTVKEL